MSERFKFGKIPISENPRPNKKIDGSKDEKKISRRTFLKIGAAAGVVGAAGIGGKMIMDKFEKPEDQREAEPDGPTPQQEKIEKQDIDIVGETIENQLENKENITLNRDTKKAIYNKWLESYSPEGENYPGLETAMRRMKPWEEMMKEEFQQVGVPKKYAFLAIPESHFDITARSRKYAKGPYQFTASSAKLYKLQVDDGYDERYDPVLSANACARHLKDSYERFNEDWDLALADYNGGYTNEYAKFRKNRSERNYENYLAWRQARLNEFNSRSGYEHKIRKNDKNLSKISKMYGVSVEKIKKFNRMTSDVIIVGKTLKLPPEISVKMRMLRDSLENLNYPEKFYAVLDVIKKEKLSEKMVFQEMNFNEFVVERQGELKFEHEVGKGEGLFAIARKFGAKARKKDPNFKMSVMVIQGIIQKQNGIRDARKIHLGQKIKINLSHGVPLSLKRVAEKHKTDLGLVKKYNPAVTRSNSALPVGVKIRIPKK